MKITLYNKTQILPPDMSLIPGDKCLRSFKYDLFFRDGVVYASRNYGNHEFWEPWSDIYFDNNNRNIFNIKPTIYYFNYKDFYEFDLLKELSDEKFNSKIDMLLLLK